MALYINRSATRLRLRGSDGWFDAGSATITLTCIPVTTIRAETRDDAARFERIYRRILARIQEDARAALSDPPGSKPRAERRKRIKP